jgi:YidC/Oxa1 family membrane protein insertase
MLTFGPIKYLAESVMLPFLDFFYHSIFANYGVAIIVLTLAIRIAFIPLMKKQYASMKAMQDLQPEQAKLKEKYASDPKQLQVETMNLFKKHKVNPLQGCLPLLFQMPFFFAIYATILNDKFTAMIYMPDVASPGLFTFWLSDLSKPDSTLILPIILALFTYYSQKLTMQNKKQQMFLIFMPVFMLFISVKLASGVILYWTVSTVFQTVQQYMTVNQKLSKN